MSATGEQKTFAEKWTAIIGLPGRQAYVDSLSREDKKQLFWELAELEEAEKKARLTREWADLQPQLPDMVQAWMKGVGIAPMERKARPEDVTREIRAKLPADTMQALRDGLLPTRGFGISGPAGCGKTFALVAVVRRHFEAWAQLVGPKKGDSLLTVNPSWVKWCPWPEIVAGIKGRVSERNSGQAVEELVLDLMKGAMLFLDDLGAERIKGGYEDDWGASHLDRIIDHRHRHELPLFFSTNLGRDALLERYGARMTSRLFSMAPLIELSPTLPDRRP